MEVGGGRTRVPPAPLLRGSAAFARLPNPGPGPNAFHRSADRYNVNDNFHFTGQAATAAMRRTIGTRSERVRELIEEGIATGEFPPGMRLDETELAERFDVSRTPLREALFQLASAGIVVRRPSTPSQSRASSLR